MNIYENGQKIGENFSHTVTVVKTKKPLTTFKSFTFHNVENIYITNRYFNICDKDFGTHTYTKSEYKYYIK